MLCIDQCTDTNAKLYIAHVLAQLKNLIGVMFYNP